MPRIVDHVQRRREVARAVLQLVARDGVDGVTLAVVSDESGWSRGVLTHYFDNKDALLEAALREGMRGLSENLSAASDEPNSRTRLYRMLEEMLPLDERRLAFSRIYVSFMAKALVSERLQAYFDRNHAAWRNGMADVIEAGRDRGELPPGPDAAGLAAALAALAEGLRMRVLSEGSTRPADLSAELRRWVDVLVFPGQ